MKYSTIGTSWITDFFISAAKQSEKAELISCYSRSDQTGEAFANKHGINRWHTDLDKMLDDPSDFIYIASPNTVHFEQIIKCLEKGKHVFCEKPMVYTEEQWKKIYEQAKKSKRFVLEGYRHLYTPNYDRLKENMSKVGQVRSAVLQFAQYSSRYDEFKKGNITNVFSIEYGGGALMDLGVYPLSMAMDLFGEPNDIHYYPELLENGADGSGTLILSYEGFTVTILCSKIYQATIPSEIQGEAGTLTMDHIAPIESLTFYDVKEKSTKQLAVKQHEQDMIYQIKAFVEMVNREDWDSYEKSMERSRQTVAWAEKARKQQNILFPSER